MPVIFNHLFTHGQNFTHTVQIPPVRNFLEVPALWNCNFSFLVNYTRTLTQQAKLDTDEITWIFSFDCVQRVVQMMIIKKCNTWRHPAFSPSFRLCFFFFFFWAQLFKLFLFSLFSPLQTDVPIPQFQHHWTQPHGPLQRLCGSCFGWPESLALSGRKVGHMWESGQ